MKEDSQYKCFVCSSDWHSGNHSQEGCMKRLAKSYEILSSSLHDAIQYLEKIQKQNVAQQRFIDQMKFDIRTAESV